MNECAHVVRLKIKKLPLESSCIAAESLTFGTKGSCVLRYAHLLLGNNGNRSRSVRARQGSLTFVAYTVLQKTCRSGTNWDAAK